MQVVSMSTSKRAIIFIAFHLFLLAMSNVPNFMNAAHLNWLEIDYRAVIYYHITFVRLLYVKMKDGKL